VAVAQERLELMVVLVVQAVMVVLD